MAGMVKVVALWTGWAGGPGYSNFYFSPDAIQNATHVTNVQARVKAFFSAFTLCLPTGLSIQVQQDSQIVASATGAIVDTISATSLQAAVAGAGAANFSAISGACVIWKTGITVHSHQLKGKTFLVPLTNGAYDTDGTILASRLTELRTAATALAAAGAFPVEEQLVVWHRPVAGAGGSASTTVSSSVNDRVAYLKSRRA